MKIDWGNKWVRLVIHTPHGAGISFLGLLIPSLLVRYLYLGTAWAVLCIIYQILEDWWIRHCLAIGNQWVPAKPVDSLIERGSFMDWRGYMVGYVLPLLFKGIVAIVRWVI